MAFSRRGPRARGGVHPEDIQGCVRTYDQTNRKMDRVGAGKGQGQGAHQIPQFTGNGRALIYDRNSAGSSSWRSEVMEDRGKRREEPNRSSRSWAPDPTLLHYPSPFAPLYWDDDPVPFLFHIEASAEAIASGAPARRSLNPPQAFSPGGFFVNCSPHAVFKSDLRLVAPPLSRVRFFSFSAL